MEIKKANCMFCHRNCGMLVEVEDGRITSIRGNPDQVVSRGGICVRGATGIEFHYHPDRLNYPMKRAGERGENKWKRITWEQALDEIAEKLSRIKGEYGAEAVATGRGTYRTDYWALTRFQHLFGRLETV